MRCFVWLHYRADFRLAPSQWETSLQSNAVSNWLVANLESVLHYQFLASHVIHPDSKVREANMGPTWGLSAPDGPHVGPMNLAIRACIYAPHVCFTGTRTISWLCQWSNLRGYGWNRPIPNKNEARIVCIVLWMYCFSDKYVVDELSHNGPISQIAECVCSIPHNAPFRTEMCTFMFWMEQCGIWKRCILGFFILWI